MSLQLETRLIGGGILKKYPFTTGLENLRYFLQKEARENSFTPPVVFVNTIHDSIVELDYDIDFVEGFEENSFISEIFHMNDDVKIEMYDRLSYFSQKHPIMVKTTDSRTLEIPKVSLELSTALTSFNLFYQGLLQPNETIIINYKHDPLTPERFLTITYENYYKAGSKIYIFHESPEAFEKFWKLCRSFRETEKTYFYTSYPNPPETRIKFSLADYSSKDDDILSRMVNSGLKSLRNHDK